MVPVQVCYLLFRASLESVSTRESSLQAMSNIQFAEALNSDNYLKRASVKKKTTLRSTHGTEVKVRLYQCGQRVSEQPVETSLGILHEAAL